MIFQGGAAIYTASLEVLSPLLTVAVGQNDSLRFLGKNPKIWATSQLAERN